uniref:Uncharacterized protein n=1 Tax=Lepeophtheirus salmonis TaxID=72036 RepID=A0A0K2TMW7_LEPSM
MLSLIPDSLSLTKTVIELRVPKRTIHSHRAHRALLGQLRQGLCCILFN